MEADVALGSVGGLKLSLVGGSAVVSVSVKESVLGGSVVGSASASATVDSSALADMLFKEIELKSPAGAVPIEETVKTLIKAALAAIK